MSEKYNEMALKDFVAWVRHRKPFGGDIDKESLEYIAQGVERFLDGKSPWIKQKGNKPKTDIMWNIFWHCFFDSENPELLQKRHKDENGLYEAVGQKLNLSADATESHYRNALSQYNTQDGKVEFTLWLLKHKGVTCIKFKPQS